MNEHELIEHIRSLYRDLDSLELDEWELSNVLADIRYYEDQLTGLQDA